MIGRTPPEFRETRALSAPLQDGVVYVADVETNLQEIGRMQFELSELRQSRLLVLWESEDERMEPRYVDSKEFGERGKRRCG